MPLGKFWFNASSHDAFLMPKGLRNGLHIVEADIGKKWVTVKAAGKSRGRKIPRARWDRLQTVPFTGQTYGQVFLEFRGGKSNDAPPSCKLPEVTAPGNPAVGLGTVPEGSPVSGKPAGAARRYKR